MKKSDLVKFFSEANKPKLSKVSIEGLGDIYVRALTVQEVEEQINDMDSENKIARNIARVLCNEDGERLLDPNNDSDVALIASQPWESIMPIRQAIDKLSEAKKPLAD